MIITLINGKKIEILGVNLRNSTIDFKWIDGVYGGDCAFNIELEDGVMPDEADILEAANKELVTEDVV